MTRLAAPLAAFLIAAAAGVWVGSEPTHPSPAPDSPPSPPSTPSTPPSPHTATPPDAPVPAWDQPPDFWVMEDIPRLEARLQRVEDELAALRADDPAPVSEWDGLFPDDHRAARIKDALDADIADWPDGVTLIDVSCPPEPCVMALRIDVEAFDDPSTHDDMRVEDKDRVEAAYGALAAHLGFPQTARRRTVNYLADEPYQVRSLWWAPPGLPGDEVSDLEREVVPRIRRAHSAWGGFGGGEHGRTY